MEAKLFELLKKNPDFLSTEGEVLKDRVIDSAYKADRKLIELLLENAELKKKFFSEIQGHWVFNINDFVMFVQDKHFLNDSYTKYKNKIGLTIDGKFLNERKEVALVWPFKDTVLEGGMTKEDQKKKEIFFNEILAQDEIDKLLAPKVLTNWKRYTVKGEEEVQQLKRDENGTIKENLIIKGNNLLALHTIKEQFLGKVKLIYIDPPYYFSETKPEDVFAYNSNFKLSTWLTFMKNRLEMAKLLLSQDGVIFVQIDDDGQAYLKVLLDDLFGANYLNTIIVKAKATSGASGGGEDKKIKKNTEYIHVYKKSDIFLKFNDQYIKIALKEYINDLKEEDKSFAYKSVLFDEGKKEYFGSTKDGRGAEIKIFKHTDYVIKTINQVLKEENISEIEVYEKYIDKIFTTENAQTSIRDRVLEATDTKDTFYTIEYIPVSGKNKGKITNVSFIGTTKRLVSFLKESCVFEEKKIFKLLKLGTLWDDISWSSVFVEGGVKLKNGKKPEKLLQRILEMTTSEDDIVLDYHLGSGTTLAVAHKMNRQYIGMEQIDTQMNLSIQRLDSVIKGDESGISKDVNWKGGGDFVYCELMKYNERFVEEIENARDTKVLLKIWEQMKEKAFFKHNFEMQEFEKDIEEFKKLDLEKQKQVLFCVLDKNQLYVNYSEIEDKKFKVEKKDKEINKEFYE